MSVAEVTKVIRNAFDAKEMWCSVTENKDFTRVVVPVGEEKNFLIDIKEEKRNVQRKTSNY